jgi:hypothetical protein
MRTRLSEHHFLTMVNDMGCWHLCSEIQDGCIMPDTSLLSLGEELVEIIPYYKAQNIFATMCQVITTPKKPFIHLELNDIIDAMKKMGVFGYQ